MIYKERTKPYPLVMLEFLSHRMKFVSKWWKKLAWRRKGYRGELELDTHTVKLGDNLLVVNDLCLPNLDEGTTFQMDTLVIAAKKIYMYEVKNHGGSYYIKNGCFYTAQHEEVVDLSFQVRKSATFLRQWLKSLGLHFEVETILVFIDPTFMLYQAPLDFPFLLKGQLEEHFQNLQQREQHTLPQQQKLAKLLVSKHIPKLKNEDLPKYQYHELKKGIACAACHSLHVRTDKYSCICRKCGFCEKTTLAIRRSIEEFQLLFPDNTLTANEIRKWCVSPSQQQVSRVLRKHYTLHGHTRAARYE